MRFGVSHAHMAAFPCWSVACWGGTKDKATEPNRNKISVLDARLLGSVQYPKRRSLKGLNEMKTGLIQRQSGKRVPNATQDVAMYDSRFQILSTTIDYCFRTILRKFSISKVFHAVQHSKPAIRDTSRCEDLSWKLADIIVRL